MQILRGFGGHTLNRGGGTAIVQGDGSIDITPKSGEIVSVSGDMSVLNGFGLVIGHTAQLSIDGKLAEAQIIGTAAADARLSIARFSVDLATPSFVFLKSRATSPGSFAAVAAADILGQIDFFGDDATDYDTFSATIQVIAEGTIGTGRVPSKMVFSTGTDASSTVVTTALTLDSSQNAEFASTIGVGVAPSTAIAVFALISSTNSIGYFRNSHGSVPAGVTIHYSASAPNGTGNLFLHCFDTGASRCDIRSNGGIANFQSNDANFSDERKKRKYGLLESTWDMHKNIEFWNFKYLDNLESRMMAGVMAQQIAEVAPALFSEYGWGDGEHHAVHSKDLEMYTARTVQECQTRIEKLEHITELLAA